MSTGPALACLRKPAVPLLQCQEEDERRCLDRSFIYEMEHPPWFQCLPQCPVFLKPLVRRAEYDYELTYNFQKDYIPAAKEHLVEPIMAYWYYCDHVPDIPGRPRDHCPHKQAGPWPPIQQDVCPPPVECEPCGPGPWANPHTRKFFYMDWQGAQNALYSACDRHGNVADMQGMVRKMLYILPVTDMVMLLTCRAWCAKCFIFCL
ncbi:hypothetical protein RRG08_042474 [Elysia crispata]|uniref:Uncharacterized protein n=1 Tax=Elysia crispata TaxID=231223 RepID=A0AAE1DDN2_9GAST|nr:hypothetical protein RRG08_042474 [Elysia crispata]